MILTNGEEIKDLDSVVCPKGWNWEDDWAIDYRRGCDADGMVGLLY